MHTYVFPFYLFRKKETNDFGILYMLKTQGRFLDKDMILWKLQGDEIIGKRSVWTKDLRACWLEDTTLDNIKSWLCGETADYTEIFKIA